MIATVFAMTIALPTHRIARTCPTKLSDISAAIPNSSQLTEKPSFYYPRCRLNVARILEAAATRDDTTWLNADYLKLSIADFSMNCRASTPTSALKTEGEQLFRQGVVLNINKIGSPEFVEADRYFDNGDFVSGFKAFATSLRFQNEITTRSATGRAYFLAGMKAGTLGHFATAEVLFKQAHEFATKAYPFADSLYFLGVSRLAEGQSALAYETFCMGAGEYVTAIAPPGDYRIPPGLLWDFLIANRIANISLPK